MEFLPFASIEDMMPAFAMLILFSVPIIAILTKHQQKMAEILNQHRAPQESSEFLHRELLEVKSLVAQQSIAIDTLMESNRLLAQKIQSAPALDERLNA